MINESLYMYNKKRNSNILGKLFSTYVYIIFILWSVGFGFFYVLPYFKDLYWVDSLSIITFIVCVIFFFLVFFNTRVLRFSFPRSSLFWIFFFFIAASCVFSCYKYSQGLLETFKYAAYYLIPLFSIFVYFQFPKQTRSFSAVSKAIINVSIIDSIIALLSYAFIANFGINLLNIPYSLRNASPRFTIGVEVVLISIFISINKSFKTKKLSLTDATNIILGTLQFFIAGKTRSFILYYVVTLLFIIALYSNVKTKIWFYVSLFILFLVFVFNANSIITLFSNYFLNDDGIYVRFEAISFFINQFVSKPIFGMGFISSEGPYSYLLGGINGTYYYDDVGIVGLLAQFGLTGLLWEILILATAYLQSTKSKLLVSSILKTLVFYMAISSINLLFIDGGKLIYLFMLFALNDFCYPINVFTKKKQRNYYFCGQQFVLNSKLKGSN